MEHVHVHMHAHTLKQMGRLFFPKLKESFWLSKIKTLMRVSKHVSFLRYVLSNLTYFILDTYYKLTSYKEFSKNKKFTNQGICSGRSLIKYSVIHSCMHAFIHSKLCVLFAFMFVHIRVEAREQPWVGVFLNYPLPYILRQGSHWTWRSPI